MSATHDIGAVAPAYRPQAVGRLHDRVLHVVLFITMLFSPIVMIEPAPYDALIFVLALAAMIARVPLDVRLLPLILLLLLLCAGGAASLIPVLDDPTAVQYLMVSFYLAISAMLFAALISEDSVRRLRTLRRGYILAALFVAVLGTIGYFKIPGFGIFTQNDRAMGTFKDPNVFGPFLVLPLLLMIQGVLERGLRLRYLLGCGIILLGLLLSFSRGAWGHFAFSALLMLLLMLVGSRSDRERARIILYAFAATLVLVLAVMVALSFDAIGSMFTERAELVQSYDGGHGGRFGRQWAGFNALFDYWNGLGPKRFWIMFGQDPHNVYINAFFSYGWLGGLSYLALTFLTLIFGFRALFIVTPWRTAFIAVYAAFVGLAAESAIIDTDHWRHYFLLLGLVWGLTAASLKSRQTALRSGVPEAVLAR
ncbi:MAG: hypothetical protein JWN71_1767 [Xanthobacteraceae bacterium]|nr:hypothetical protein [Xanthobacteraceae bacterium]